MISNNSRRKIPHIVLVRAPALLPMQYKLKELAEEIGIASSTLRDWLNQGAPHQRDRRGHLWVNGQEFANWVEANHRRPRRLKLADGEAFCLHCHRPVKLENPEIIPIKGLLINIRGTCPDCGCVINRGGRNGKSR
jgi:transposase-like protein